MAGRSLLLLLLLALLAVHAAHGSSLFFRLFLHRKFFAAPAPRSAASNNPSRMNLRLVAGMPRLHESGSGRIAFQDRPQPEECVGCSQGVLPQPESAGRVVGTWPWGAAPGSSSGPGGAAPPPAPPPAHAAVPGQFPWHAALVVGNQYVCSASLVSELWLLTAAHCLHGRSKVEVRLGSYMPSDGNERHRVNTSSRHLVLHPGYKPTSTLHDIAALRLSSPVKFNRYILPVRLPSLSSFTTTFEGRKAKLSGWGVTSPVGIFNSEAVLGFVVESVLSTEECSRTFGTQVGPSHLCTTTQQFTTDGCTGDSGAPLVVSSEDEKNVFIQVGIFSFVSDGGCTAGSPAGFTRITSYSRWIENTTGIALHPTQAS